MGVVGIVNEELVQEVALQHVLDDRVLGNGLDVVIAILAERHGLTNIQAHDDLLLERRANSHLGGIGVQPPVELGGRRGITWLEEGTAHVDDTLHQWHNLGSNTHRRGNVDTGADGDDGDLARMGLHLVDDEVDGLHVKRLHGRLLAVMLEIDRLP